VSKPANVRRRQLCAREPRCVIIRTRKVSTLETSPHSPWLRFGCHDGIEVGSRRKGNRRRSARCRSWWRGTCLGYRRRLHGSFIAEAHLESRAPRWRCNNSLGLFVCLVA
jgi:hypothetical protein